MARRVVVFLVVLASLVGSLSLVSFMVLAERPDLAGGQSRVQSIAWPLAIIFGGLFVAGGLVVVFWDEIQAANRREQQQAMGRTNRG